MSLKTDIDKLRRASAAEILLLMEAMTLLCVVKAGVLTLPFRWLAALTGLELSSATTAEKAGPEGDPEWVGKAVRAMAARTPWKSTCLVQAITGAIMLRRRGIPASLLLGVAKESGLIAHAWLKSGDVFVTGYAGHQTYRVISVFTVSPR
ncbi:hypothetical protein H261_03728 [Paramagnetospirillum caucaseum]|uniref:Microcin J25-processing protein McjB C-terminal domain-containing protein n=1 Tax=Paramagnetospirillum caucaseum TaxID=1244869 RepID=M3AFC2_9PROT|nr:lasso peptide biosynthesis B2 protein [Paramagnetospirillum caucaseum]EME71274.1 hypothetical protein H261_03728 [Paramagnetospirillum caucaseum]